MFHILAAKLRFPGFQIGIVVAINLLNVQGIAVIALDNDGIHANGFQCLPQVKEKLAKIIMSRNEDFLKKVVLADKVVYGSTEGFVKEWNINGEDITLAVK